ncbi:hypothetical protein BH09ACT6_BH09ACT6_22070 [soil metagenome]
MASIRQVLSIRSVRATAALWAVGALGAGVLTLGSTSPAAAAPSGPTVIHSVVKTINKVLDQPTAVAVDESTHTTYVVLRAANTVSVVANDYTITRVALPMDAKPIAIAIDAATHTAYVATINSGVQVIREAQLVAPIPLADEPTAIAFDSSTSTLYVPTIHSKVVAITAGASATIPTGVTGNPSAIAIDPTTSTAYVANLSGEVVTIRGGTLRDTIPLAGYQPRSIAVDTLTHTVYVPNTGGTRYAQIDGTTVTPNTTGLAQIENLAVREKTHTVVVVTNEGVLLDSESGASRETYLYAAGTDGRDIAVDQASGDVYVAGDVYSTLLVFHIGFIPGANVIPEVLQLGGNTGHVAVDQTTRGAYVATYSDSSLSVIQATWSPIIAQTTPPGAMVGVPYTFAISVTARPAPTFTVSLGTLPDGLSLDPDTGIISGRPLTAGSSTFTVTVSNGQRPADSAEFTLDVAAAVTPPPTPTPTPTTSTPGNGGTGTTGGGAAIKPALANTGLDLTTFWPLIAVGAMLVATGALGLTRRAPRSTRKRR